MVTDARSLPRGEVVQTPAPWDDLPAAAAWLLGYVDTSNPGYRSVGLESSAYLLPPAYSRFDAYIAAINYVGLSNVGDDVAVWRASGKGQFTSGEESAVMDSSPDRLGWVIGCGVEAGFAGVLVPRFIPPAGIPLIGATWDRVEIDADRRKIADMYRRNQGYVWGAARLFTCRLYMHRYSFEALSTGWCMAGKVTLGGATKLDDPWSLADPKGAVTGYVVGVEAPEWQGQRQERAVVTMTIATGAA